MMNYLRALGMPNASIQSILASMLMDAANKPDTEVVHFYDSGNGISEISKYIGQDFGLMIYTSIDENDKKNIDMWSIFAESELDITVEPLALVKGADGFDYLRCRESSTRNEFDFRVNNRLDFVINYGLQNKITLVNIVGLCPFGRLIAPVEKPPYTISMTRMEDEFYAGILSGYGECREKSFMSLRSLIDKRIRTNDDYPDCTSVFLPFSAERGIFYILGEVKSFLMVANTLTGGRFYKLLVSVKKTVFYVAINEMDLDFAPEAGMRFEGLCFLQGSAFE